MRSRGAAKHPVWPEQHGRRGAACATRQVLGGSAQVEYGTGKRRRASLAMDLPLGEKTAMRIVAGGEKADALSTIQAQRDDTGGWDSAFARIKLLHRDDPRMLPLHHANLRGGNDHG